MTIVIRVVQELNAVGEPAPMVFVEHVRQAKSLQTWPDAVMGFLREMNPSRTGKQGLYAYSDPSRGSGLLHLEGASPIELLRIEELVHMEEIERAIGMRDPNRIEDVPGYLIPFMIRNRCPYIQILLGMMSAGAGVAVLLYLPLRDPGAPLYGQIIVPVLGLILVTLAVLLIRRGWRRLPWWHAARAQAKRDGGPMPEDLQVLG